MQSRSAGQSGWSFSHPKVSPNLNLQIVEESQACMHPCMGNTYMTCPPLSRRSCNVGHTEHACFTWTWRKACIRSRTWIRKIRQQQHLLAICNTIWSQWTDECNTGVLILNQEPLVQRRPETYPTRQQFYIRLTIPGKWTDIGTAWKWSSTVRSYMQHLVPLILWVPCVPDLATFIPTKSLPQHPGMLLQPTSRYIAVVR
jgi:hypothetical protein